MNQARRQTARRPAFLYGALIPTDPGHRMRRVATGLLVAMVALFVLARHLPADWIGRGYVVAFAEAALVGGLADWFAVTALFRRPLGLPIPHTAIIPVNKDRIADSLATFLRANFLTPQVVARRLYKLDVAGLLSDYLSRPASESGRIGGSLTGLLAEVLETLDPDKIGGPAKAMLRSQIERIDAAPLIGQVLAGMIADGRHRPLIDALLRRAGGLLEANEGALRTLIHDRANTLMRWTRLDDRLASALLDAIYALLAETLIDPLHPLRSKIDSTLEALAHDLIHDPAMRERVAQMKAEVLANAAFAAWLDGMWERSRTSLIVQLRGGGRGGAMGNGIAGFGHTLAEDPALRVMVNRFARRSLTGLASRHGDGIVRIVSETVRRWDARTVTDRIESAVGRDLQFIRINGTLVGGLVGLTLHAAERFIF